LVKEGKVEMKISRMEEGWVEAIMSALIPPGGDDRYPLSALDTGAVEIYREMLLYLPRLTGLGLRAAVVMIEFWGPWLGLGKVSRFSRLGPEEKEECLVRLSQKDAWLVRQLVLLLKSVACLAWCGDQRVRAALGHELPPRFVTR